MKHKYRWMLLLAASYYFYMSWSSWFGIVLISLTLITYYTSLKIELSQNPKIRRKWFWIAIGLNLGCLLVFKYSYFFYFLSQQPFCDNQQSAYLVLTDLIVPIGLSFYTFRLLSYVIDVYRKRVQAERHAGKFALFASFFPVILSGPIERFSVLMPQLISRHRLNFQSLAYAIRIGTWGFFKKIVIADRLAEFVNPVFADPQLFSGLTLLAVAFLFVIQLYADFSGYTDIVTGIARLFGVKLSINWRRPLLARSMVVFWKRYHITLTTWFHDYVYLPMVSSSRSYAFWVINIFVVFLISGLWHGANVGYLLWGAMHGLIYLIEAIINKKFKLPKYLFVIGWLYVLVFHTLSLIAFRAESISDLGMFYSKIIALDLNLSLSIQELISLNSRFPLMVSVLLIIFLFIKELNEEFKVSHKYKRLEQLLKPLFYVFIFVLIFILGKFNSNEFIYTNF